MTCTLKCKHLSSILWQRCVNYQREISKMCCCFQACLCYGPYLMSLQVTLIWLTLSPTSSNRIASLIHFSRTTTLYYFQNVPCLNSNTFTLWTCLFHSRYGRYCLKQLHCCSVCRVCAYIVKAEVLLNFENQIIEKQNNHQFKYVISTQN